MKIVFFASSMLPIHGRTLEERPIGGMETAAIRLAEELHDLGHEVIVFTALENPPVSKVLYLPFKLLPKVENIDVFVAIREWESAFAVKAKKKFFWTGDSYNLTQSSGIGDKRVANEFNAMLCVSEWHADTFCQESGFPRSKTHILKNGVNLKYFEGQDIERQRKRLIYSSTPYRGLKFLPDVMRKLLEKHPDVELHVFSDYQVYSEDQKKYYQVAIEELASIKREFSEIPNCFMHGNIKQEQLAKEMLKSSILAYPNTFEETSCITVMEAQAAGCVVVSSGIGALRETIGDAGIIIEAEPGSTEYLEKFSEEINYFLSNEIKLRELSEKALQKSKVSGWNKVALDFLGYSAP